MNMNKQQGFTLIELVMVIVILGILAATALPKFADMQNQARIATLQGVFGSVNAAIAITHSQALVQNQLGDSTAIPAPSITLEDGTAVVLAYGYPTVGSIASGLNLSPLTDFDTTTTPGTIALTSAKDYSTAPATCAVIYHNSVAGIPPVIDIATGGC